VRSKALLILAAVVALVLGMSACGNKTTTTDPDTRVKQVVQHIKADGHKVDEIVIAVNPRTGEEEKRENAYWETETEELKKRKSKGKTITVKKNTKIAEVVVVIPGSNCKIEVEALLDDDLTTYYADEGRDKYGKEMSLPNDFPGDSPSPRELKDYMNKHKNMFAFCISQPYKASTHSDD
jgi:hypothetical protein